jgi:AcrR family transcriptional regulator
MPKSLPGNSDGKTRSGGARQRRGARDHPGAPGRSGRRPGASGTREAILAAAQRQFAEVGYDRASLRSIAGEAGVDQKLVAYFFGSKQKLLAAAVAFPYDPAETIPGVLGGDPEGMGERMASFLLGLLEEREARDRIVALIRAAASEPEAAQILRDRLLHEFGGPVAKSLASEDAVLRASLVNTLCVGLVVTRYIIGAEPLASVPPDALAAAIGPALQSFLAGPLPGT